MKDSPVGMRRQATKEPSSIWRSHPFNVARNDAVSAVPMVPTVPVVPPVQIVRRSTVQTFKDSTAMSQSPTASAFLARFFWVSLVHRTID
jgi:hypothetical protein